MHSELTVTIEAKRNISMAESPYRLSQLIGFAMLKDNYLKDLHSDNDIKPYVYDGLYPYEKDRIIKQGRLYIFHIKSPEVNVITSIDNVFSKTESSFFKVIHTSIRNIDNNKIIKSIKTVTPISSFIDNKPWTKEMGIMQLVDRIIKNTSHKYDLFYKSKIPHENWIAGINIISEKPISLKYKCKLKNKNECKYSNSRCNKFCEDYNPMGIIGYKIELNISTDKESQEIAKMLLGSGILEKNAVLGMGYTV